MSIAFQANAFQNNAFQTKKVFFPVAVYAIDGMENMISVNDELIEDGVSAEEESDSVVVGDTQDLFCLVFDGLECEVKIADD